MNLISTLANEAVADAEELMRESQDSAAYLKDADGEFTVDHTGNIVIINPMGHYHGFMKLPHDSQIIRLTYQTLAARF